MVISSLVLGLKQMQGGVWTCQESQGIIHIVDDSLLWWCSLGLKEGTADELERRTTG